MPVAASTRAPQRIALEPLPGVCPHAAGVDIGSPALVVALPPERPAPTVRAFGPVTTEVKPWMAWALAQRLGPVAMASTGLDWMPIDELLAVAGIRGYLVTARHVQLVPGRTTDSNEAPWRPKLPSLGWLHAACRPEEAMWGRRCVLRPRAPRVEPRAPHLLPLPKALQLLNMPLPEGLSEVTGVTGFASLRAMVAGERRGPGWANRRRPACQKTAQAMVEALPGPWRDAPLFVRQHSLARYADDTSNMAECAPRIDPPCSAMQPRVDVEGDPPAPPKSARSKAPHPSPSRPPTAARMGGAAWGWIWARAPASPSLSPQRGARNSAPTCPEFPPSSPAAPGSVWPPTTTSPAAVVAGPAC
jgi:transposase